MCFDALARPGIIAPCQSDNLQNSLLDRSASPALAAQASICKACCKEHLNFIC